MDSSKFSYFLPGINARDKKPEKPITLEELKKAITGGRLAERTQKLRQLPNDKKRRDDFKRKNLPYVTPSGEFGVRKAANLISKSGFITIDLDHLSDPEEVRNKLAEASVKPIFMFTSPSGTGLKVFYQYDKELDHKTVYDALEAYLNEEFELTADEKCKDISRACFLCHDPKADIYPGATKIDNSFVEKYKQKAQKTKQKASEIEQKELQFKLLFEACETYVKKNLGVDFETGQRNKFIYEMAGLLCRGGIEIEVTLNKLKEFAEIDFDESEIEATIKSIYENAISKDLPLEVLQLIEEQKNTIIRIGDVFYKKIISYDKEGQEVKTLIRRSRQTIVDDFGLDFVKKQVTKYDTFVNVPLHTGYKSVIGECYNLYNPLPHAPAPGTWQTIEKLLLHVFGEQYQLGLDYLQLLYKKPTQLLPILCLVSKENHTGKTTFANLGRYIFGQNATVITNTEFAEIFNGSYAAKLLIAVEEGKFQDNKLIDRIKNLSTAKQIQLRKMHQEHIEVDFFGKFIILSNYEDSFINIGESDIRYWVRKLPKIKEYDPDFESKLKNEVPAFLYYLQDRELFTSNETRMHFNPDLLITDALQNVRIESRSDVAKELIEVFETYLSEVDKKGNLIRSELKFTVTDLRFDVFENKVSGQTIRRALKNELGLETTKTALRYSFFMDNQELRANTKTGNYYTVSFVNISDWKGVKTDSKTDS